MKNESLFFCNTRCLAFSVAAVLICLVSPASAQPFDYASPSPSPMPSLEAQVTSESILQLQAFATALPTIATEMAIHIEATSIVAAIAPVRDKCLCFCANPTLGGLGSARGMNTNLLDYEYVFSRIATSTECAAQNNRRCQGFDPAPGSNYYQFGYLVSCSMTATLDFERIIP